MLQGYELYTLLLDAYGKLEWWSDDPYTVMFQAVLVQNTAWSNVERLYESMGKPDPAYILSLKRDELEHLIHGCGCYKRKAETLYHLTSWFVSHNDFSALDTATIRNELLSLKGIGMETADVILVYALYRPSFIVDAYTRRFLSRFGYTFPDDDAIRAFFLSSLGDNADVYGYFHWLILEHSKTHCKKKAKCSGCPLQHSCAMDF